MIERRKITRTIYVDGKPDGHQEVEIEITWPDGAEPKPPEGYEDGRATRWVIVPINPITKKDQK